MSVELVPVNYMAPKELNDVRIALVALVMDIKMKKPLSEIAADSLGNFVKVVDGFQEIPAEAKEAMGNCFEMGGHMGGQLLAALLAPAPQAQAA